MASRRILITGANSGIGFEAARQLLERGHHLALACRSAQRAENTAAALQLSAGSSGSVWPLVCDLSRLESVRAAAATVLQRWNTLDVVVCNAAVITASPQLTEDGLDEMYQVGHVAQLLLTNLLLPALSAAPSGGRIVWVGSQLAESTPPRLAADPELFHRLHGRCGDSDGLSAAAAAAAGGSGGQQQQQQQQQQQHLTSSTAASAPSASSAAVAVQPPPRPMDLYRLVKLYNAWAVAHMTRASILPGGASIPAAGCSAGGVVVANLVSPGFVPATGLSRHLGGMLGRLAMRYLMPWAPFAVTPQEAGGRVAALCDGTAEVGETGGCYYVRRVAQPLAHGAAGMLGDEAAAAAAWARSCQDAGITGAPWVPKLPC